MNWAHDLLQANIYLVVFYAFYQLLLAKETYFRYNRIYLLSAGLLAMLLPYVRLEWLFTAQSPAPAKGMITLDVLISKGTVASSGSETLSIGAILAMVYLLGLLFFTGRFLYQLLKVNQLLKADHFSGTTSIGAAFSFFNHKVIDTALPELQTIERHEQVHSRQWHTLDVLLFELLAIVCWFNPIIYLYKNSLKRIHEYLADEEAVQVIGDKQQYALLLLSKSFGVPLSNLTNSFFNQSLLKNRIKMLNQEKSPKKALLKYGLYLPVFGLALLLSSATLRNDKRIKELTATIPLEKPLSLVQSITSPRQADGWDDFFNHAKRTVRYPQQAQTEKLQGDAHIKFSLKDGTVENLGVAEKPLGAGFDTEVMKSILAYNKFKAMPDGNYLLTVAFRVKDSEKPVQRAEDVKLSGYTNLNTLAINSEDIVHEFVKIDQAPTFTGGMDKFYAYLSRAIKYPKEAVEKKVEGKVFVSFIVEQNGELTNINVDRRLGSGTDEEAVRVLEASPRWIPGKIAGEAVRVKYNIPIGFSLGKKTANSSTIEVVNTGSGSANDKKPLIYVDGVKSDDEGMKSLDPKVIESLEVLKDVSAVALYGEEARNGVILITTKVKSGETTEGTKTIEIKKSSDQ